MRRAALIISTGVMLIAAAVQVKAEEVNVDVELGFVETPNEVIYTTHYSSTGGKDTYHFDLNRRIYTIVSDDGYVEEGPIAQNIPAWVPCLAGPQALAGCAVVTVFGYLACQTAQSNTIRRLNRDCQTRLGAGAIWEPSNSGVCGQVMQGMCRVQSIKHHEQEP